MDRVRGDPPPAVAERLSVASVTRVEVSTRELVFFEASSRPHEAHVDMKAPIWSQQPCLLTSSQAQGCRLRQMKKRAAASTVIHRRTARRLYLPEDGTADEPPKAIGSDSEDYRTLVVADEEDARRRCGKHTPATDGRIAPLEERMRLAAGSGLDRALDAENPGFRMLVAMGYCVGEGIGARSQGRRTPLVAEGMLEPRTRAGLGLLEARRRAQASVNTAKAQAESDRRMAFRAAKHTKGNDLAALRAARRARHAVCDLDERAGTPRHDLWPSSALEDVDSEGVNAEPPLLQLRAAVIYLRDVHRYCLSTGAELGSGDEPTLEEEVAALLDDAVES